MSAVAVTLIEATNAAGGTITLLDGNDLWLSAPQPLPLFLRLSIRAHKPAIIAFLQRQQAPANTDRPPGAAADDETTADAPQALATAASPQAPAEATPAQPDQAAASAETLPAEIARGTARLFAAPPIPGVPDRHWRRIVSDTLAFVQSGQAAQALALDWTPGDLFGCDQRAPWHRIDRAGLVLLIGGKTVGAITADSIALHCRDGAVLRFRPKRPPPPPPVVLLWHLLPKQQRPNVGPAP